MIVVLLRLITRFYPAGTLSDLDFVVFWIVSAAAIALVVWLALGVMEQSYSFGPWNLLYWVGLGPGRALVCGILAGFVIDSALQPNWQDVQWQYVEYKGIAVFLGGCGIALLALFWVGVPGAFQRVTGVKAGEVEVTLAVPQARIQPPASGFRGAALVRSAGPEYSPWFNNFWYMMTTGDPTDVEFPKREYFRKEAAYLNLVERTRSPPPRRAPALPKDWQEVLSGETLFDGDVAGAFWRQAALIKMFRPIVGCGAFYHKHFPDLRTIRRLSSKMLEDMLAFEFDLEAMSLDPDSTNGTILSTDAGERLRSAWNQGWIANAHFQGMLKDLDISPNRADEALKGTLPSEADCGSEARAEAAPYIDFVERVMSSDSPDWRKFVVPPYWSMLIANIYAALGEKDDGLVVLNKWSQYYDNYTARPTHPSTPLWFRDRAYIEYGSIQEADEAAPTSSAEKFYLGHMANLFRGDWSAAMTNAEPCHSNIGGHRSGESNADSDDRSGAAARLHLLYYDTQQRWLYALLNTRSARAGKPLNAEDEKVARELIDDAGHCVVGEDDRWRDYRQTLEDLVGGLFLAAWADEAPGTGMLGAARADHVRKDALQALLHAWPVVVRLAREERTTEPPLRVMPSYWEYYLHTAEPVILDLEAQQAH